MRNIHMKLAASSGNGVLQIDRMKIPVRVTSMTHDPWSPLTIEVMALGSVCSNYNYDLAIERVIYNDPATIVFWKDGSKTVVKCQKGDRFDPEKGLAMAMCKKALGNKGNYCNVFKKHLPEEEFIDYGAKIRELEKKLYSHMMDVFTDTELEG